jgi:methylmalonyl-CoA mutase cobalamin-binding subunit
LKCQSFGCFGYIYRTYCPSDFQIINEYGIKDILITGGGAYNTFLIEKIKAKTTSEIIIPKKRSLNIKKL